MTSPTKTQEPTPLSEATFLILLSLARAPKHGYAIWKDVETLSDGRVVFSTGTLYGALKRLLELGWIERLDDRAGGDKSRSRKAYVLTGLGRRITAAEARRMRALVDAARLRLIEEQGQ